MTAAPLPVDPGLLARFRSAGPSIAWRDADARGGGRRGGAGAKARIAHLNDEEARVETQGRGSAFAMRVDSGPVGALVLLLEADRRGAPAVVVTHEAGALSAFPQGAIEARWGARPQPAAPGPSIRDLVELARYALA